MKMDDAAFEAAIKSSRVPILMLDQKWHRLFAISGKPEEVKALEAEIGELMQRQAKLQEEERRLKKIKADLMQQIMDNMEGADSSKDREDAQKSLDEAKRLMDETNAKLAEDEDELLDIPKQIRDKNNELMLLTMQFSYDKLRSNTDEINKISEWIADVRVKLKQNIIKKQNREINNKEMYSYMHDIFGKDVMRMFDLHYDEGGKLILKEHLEQEQIEAATFKRDKEKEGES